MAPIKKEFPVAEVVVVVEPKETSLKLGDRFVANGGNGLIKKNTTIFYIKEDVEDDKPKKEFIFQNEEGVVMRSWTFSTWNNYHESPVLGNSARPVTRDGTPIVLHTVVYKYLYLFPSDASVYQRVRAVSYHSGRYVLVCDIFDSNCLNIVESNLLINYD
jgi:hypothetical protein